VGQGGAKKNGLGIRKTSRNSTVANLEGSLRKGGDLARVKIRGKLGLGKKYLLQCWVKKRIKRGQVSNFVTNWFGEKEGGCPEERKDQT